MERDHHNFSRSSSRESYGRSGAGSRESDSEWEMNRTPSHTSQGGGGRAHSRGGLRTGSSSSIGHTPGGGVTFMDMSPIRGDESPDRAATGRWERSEVGGTRGGVASIREGEEGIGFISRTSSRGSVMSSAHRSEVGSAAGSSRRADSRAESRGSSRGDASSSSQPRSPLRGRRGGKKFKGFGTAALREGKADEVRSINAAASRRRNKKERAREYTTHIFTHTHTHIFTHTHTNIHTHYANTHTHQSYIFTPQCTERHLTPASSAAGRNCGALPKP